MEQTCYEQKRPSQRSGFFSLKLQTRDALAESKAPKTKPLFCFSQDCGILLFKLALRQSNGNFQRIAPIHGSSWEPASVPGHSVIRSVEISRGTRVPIRNTGRARSVTTTVSFWKLVIWQIFFAVRGQIGNSGLDPLSELAAE